MLLLDVLRQLNLGNSVAEFDTQLERYFVETETFRTIVQDEADIIAGDKGTGKTALFRILHKRYAALDDLHGIEVLPAFNIQGNPVFQRLTEGEVYSEGQYSTLWKAYVLSLGGNYILTVFEDSWSDSMYELDELLRETGLRSSDDSPSTVFSVIVNLFRRLTNPSAAEARFEITKEGLPVVVPRVEFEEANVLPAGAAIIEHDRALGLLNRVLDEVDVSLWLVLDRLDEAFAGNAGRRSSSFASVVQNLSRFSSVRTFEVEALRSEGPISTNYRGRLRKPNARERAKG